MRFTTRGLASLVLGGLMLASLAQPATAASISSFGSGGWNSGDTRVAGVNATLQADIDSRLVFDGAAPAGAPDGPGALKMIVPGATDKATIERVANYGTLSNTFTASYSWYKTALFAPSFKIGFDSTDANPASTRIGENNWDKLLIYEPINGNGSTTATNNNVWVTETINWTTGKFWLVDRSIPTSVNQGSPQTLSWWFNTSAYASKLAAANVVTLQFGIGSNNAGGNAWLDTFSTSLLSDVQDFEGAVVVPVPTSAAMGLVTMLALGALAFNRRRVAAA